MTGIALIYATWPNVAGGGAWYKFAHAMRQAGLTRRLEAAGFDVSEYVFNAEGPRAAELPGAFALSRRIGEQVAMSRACDLFPVVGCGSCAVAGLGVLTGLGGAGTGVVWMDAHPDLNTPDTTLSGLFDGMALATPLGLCWRALADGLTGLQPLSTSSVCLYGARIIDPGEREFIDAEGIPIVYDGAGAVAALETCERVYLHLDMDVHDPARLRANTFIVPGGPSPGAICQDLQTIARELPLAAFAVTGVDPAVAESGPAIPCAIEHTLAVCESQKARPC